MVNYILYFAYGSNMNPDRMAIRCPDASVIGRAELHDYKLTERLYADIDYQEDSIVYGFLYQISNRHLKLLDKFEGVPKIYMRKLVDVVYNGTHFTALTYEMTPETKRVRNGQPYSEEYRRICSEGAK